MSNGRQHYERRVAQAAAARKPRVRKPVDEATMRELLEMVDWFDLDDDWEV